MAKRTVVEFYGENVFITALGDDGYEIAADVYSYNELLSLRDLINEIVEDVEGTPVSSIQVPVAIGSPQQPRNIWSTMLRDTPVGATDAII